MFKRTTCTVALLFVYLKFSTSLSMGACSQTPPPFRKACGKATCHACYASINKLNYLLSSDHTPMAFSNNNPEKGLNLPKIKENDKGYGKN